MTSDQHHNYRDMILDSITEGVFTVDCNLNITTFNRAAEKITGLNRADVMGKKCSDVLHVDISKTGCALQHSIETGEEIIDRHTHIRHRKGHTIPVSISTSVLRDEAQRIVGGVQNFKDLSTLELLRREIQGKYTYQDIVSKNHKIHELFKILPDIALSESSVLIEGPTGSGKELFAHALHNLSERRENSFVTINCGALPSTLLELELFGYKKGAFTDARKDKPGRFAQAHGGTIFIDEIGDISPIVQIKLLRILQDKSYEPLGGNATVKADVRIIAATNKNLHDLVLKGKFRDDLYYRINIVKLSLPALADRRDDIPLLTDYFIRKFNAQKNKNIENVSPDAMAVLLNHHYPGNIRELENIIEHAFVLCRDAEINPGHLPQELMRNISGLMDHNARSIKELRERAEATTILNALYKHEGNRQKIAAELGINKTTLWRKMKKFGLSYSRQDRQVR